MIGLLLTKSNMAKVPRNKRGIRKVAAPPKSKEAKLNYVMNNLTESEQKRESAWLEEQEKNEKRN